MTDTLISIPHDSKEFLNLLLEEYKLTISRLDEYENRMMQLIGAGATILGTAGALLGLAASQQPLPKEIVWLMPLLFIVFFSLILYSGYTSQNLIWVARILSLRINQLTPEPVLLVYEPGTPSSIFFSSRHGNVKQRMLPIVVIVMAVASYFFVVYLSARAIYESSHFAGTVFLIVYLLLFTVEAVAFTGITADLPNAFRKFEQEITQTGRIPQPLDLKHYAALKSGFSLRIILAYLIPRPHTLMVNCVGFIFGVVAALVLVGFQPSQGKLACQLFCDPAIWPDPSIVPWWAKLGTIALFFVVEEVLLQQAKYTWNDIRDIERDKITPLNQGRAVTSGLMSLKAATWNMLIRWSLAFVLGYWLGGFVLLAVFLAVSLHQVIYVLWAKQRGKAHPLFLVFFIAISLALRFPSGIIAVAGPDPTVWLIAPIILLFLMVYLLSLGSISAFWKMEAEYRRDMGQSPLIRLQGGYFLQKGYHWQHFGLLSAVLASIINLALYLVATSGGQIPVVNDWYGAYNSVQQSVVYVLLSPSQCLILIAAVVAVAMLLATVMLFPFRPIERPIEKMIVKLKPALSPLLIAAAVIAAIISMGAHNSAILFVSVILMLAGSLVNFEGLTYLEYIATPILRKLPTILKAWSDFLLKPNQPSIGTLLAYTFNSEEKMK